MQVERRRWSAVLIASSALASKGACVRLWQLQSGRHAVRHDSASNTMRVRAGAATHTKVHCNLIAVSA